MRPDIRSFIRKVNSTYKTESYYLPDKDVYAITYRGRAVMNFDTKRFYHYPVRERFNMIRPLIKVGLNHNLGEGVRDQVFHDRKIGIPIR